MSFDICLQCFGEGSRATFPRRIVDEIFGLYVVHDSAVPRLLFPDGGGGFLYIDEEDQVTGFTINRPGGLDLFRALYEILRQTPTALYWGGKPGIALVDPNVISEIHPQMIAGLGEPVIVHSGEEILAQIKGS